MGKSISSGIATRLLTALLLLSWSYTTLGAQNITISQSVQSSMDAPTADGTTYFILGSGSIEYRVDLDASVSDVKEAYWTFGSSRIPIIPTITGDKATFSTATFTPSTVGTYTPTVHIVYTPVSEDPDTTPADVSTESAGRTITVYAQPGATIAIEPGRTVFEGSGLSVTVNSTGGNPEGWQYTFHSAENTSGNTATIMADMAMNSHAPIVDVANTAPGGSTWYEESMPVNITVYSVPSVSMQLPTRTEYISGEEVNISANVSGGDPSAWTYEWTVNGVKSNINSPSFSHTTLNTGTTAINGTIELKATNTPYGIDQAWTYTYTFEYTTYPTPSFSGLSSHPTAVFSDQPLNISFSVAGGKPDQWIYILKENGIAIESEAITPGQTVTINLGVGNVTSARTESHTVEVRNTYGDQTYTNSAETTISYYPTPRATMAAPSFSSFFSGDKITLSVDSSGGQSSAWSYSWDMNGQHIGTSAATQSVTFSNTGSAMQKTTVNCRAVNAPDGIGTPAEFPLSFTADVYPLPAVGEMTLPHTAVFSGTQIQLAPEITGGNSDAWTYTWYDNNTPLDSNDATLAYTAVNTGSSAVVHTLRLVAVNTLDSGAKEFEREVTVTVWPTPSADLAVPAYNEYFNGDTGTFSVNTQGGDASAWTYVWGVDDSNIANSGASYEHTFVNDGTLARTVTVRCVATNAPEGIDASQSRTMTYTATVYPSSVLQPLTLPYSAVFAGTSVPMTATVQGGNPDGWTFEWFDNGTRLENTTEAYTFIAPATSAAETHRLVVKATNTIASGAVTAESEVTVTVWPTPSADLAVPAYNEYFNGDTGTFSVNTQGGDASAWTYVWSVDGSNIANSGASYEHTFVNDGTLARTVTVRCVATNAPEGIDAPQSRTMTYTATVYPSTVLQPLTLPYSAVFAGTSVPMTATVQGGNPDGWTFEWFDNGTRLENTTEAYTFIAPATSAAETHRLTVKATNTIASGAVTAESEVTVTVWPTSSADLAVPAYNEYFNGDTGTFSVNTQGGDASAWTYVWSVDGSNIANSGASYEHTFVNDGTLARTVTVRCVATNAPEGIDAPQSRTMTYTTTVYPSSVLQPLTLPYSAVFAGTSVPMTATVQGGNPDGWTFEWFDNGTRLENTTEAYTFIAPATSAAETHRLTVKATNTIASGAVSSEGEYTITVYPTRIANLVVPNITEWFNDRTFDLSWNITGGDPASRTYSWSIAAPSQDTLGTESTLHYTTVNTSDGPIQYTLRAVVTDAPAGIDQPVVTEQNFVFTVYPEPKLLSLIPEYPAVFDGTSVTTTATVAGGKESAWTYSWQLDDMEIPDAEAMSVTRQLTNSGTDKKTAIFTFTGKNTVGDETITLVQHAAVDVWPTASAQIVTPERTEWYSGQQIPLSATTTGGDPLNWKYTWDYNGTTFEGQDYTPVPINDGTAPRTDTVRLTVTNTPDGINAPYITTYEYTFICYPQPGIHNPTQSSGAIFSGEKVSFGITAVGGKQDDWTYRWLQDGALIENSTDKLELTLSSTSSTAEIHTFEVIATNEIDGEVTDFSHKFNVTVWPTPSAQLHTPSRSEWFVNENIAFNTTVTGGDTSAWTYKWTVNGTDLPTTDATYTYSLLQAAEGGEQKTVTVTATNTPDGIGTAYVYTQTYTCTVFPRPYITANAQYENQTVFHGTTIALAIEPHAGYPDGWTYSWSRDGILLDFTGTSIDDTPVNTSSQARVYHYSVDAFNTLDDIVIEMHHDFDVTVWPTPMAEFGTAIPTNVLSGETVSAIVSTVGGDPERWTYKWSLNGETVNDGTQNTFSTQALNADQESIVNTITVTATNTPENIDKPYTITLTHDYTIWPVPTSKSIADENIVVVSGANVTIGADIFGGQNNEWMVDWTLNGTTIGNDNSPYINITAENNSSALLTDVYTITVTNRVDGNIRYTHTYTYTVNIYPKPDMTVPAAAFDAYYGDIVTLAVIPSNGYPSGWTYTWSSHLPDQASVEYTVPTAENDDSESIVTLSVTNSYGEEIWFSQEYTFTIHGWSRGQINSSTTLESDYNGSIATILGTTQKGGYSGGWTYEWSLNGEFLSSGTSSLEVTETNYTEDAQPLLWELIATNTLNGIVGSRTTINYRTCLWPVINAPEGFSVSPQTVCAGATVTISATPDKATGGYNNEWTYSWTTDGTPIDTNSPVVYYTAGNGQSGRAYSDIVFGLHLVNVGPVGENWYDRVYPTQTLRVYNRPATPSALVRKGNGTTCTMIAMSDLTDAELTEAEYEFVFGYTSASGKDASLPATVNRFCRFTADVYNNDTNDFWVYTRWTYPNGAIVTSQRRHLSGEVDDFNGSDYGTTSDADDNTLGGAIVDDDDIYIYAKGFKLKLAEAAETTVRILTPDGNLAYTNMYPAVTTVAEDFGTLTLDTGIYIVHVEAGDKVIIKKVAIK